jgi:pilus assembly protein CpaF
LKITRERWKFKDENYGPLLEFVKDENVTDINYNGTDVWIDDLSKGRYKADVTLSKEFIATPVKKLLLI